MAKDRLVSKKYRESVNEEDVLLRLAVMDSAFVRIRSALKMGNKEGYVRLNRAVLTNALFSYYYDIIRLRDFHGSKRINRPKKAAFLIKWIVKEKPIYFDPDPFGEDSVLEVLSCVNELYAFRCALGYAGIPLNLVDATETDNMVYELAFREHSTGMMSLWFETFMNFHGIRLE